MGPTSSSFHLNLFHSIVNAKFILQILRQGGAGTNFCGIWQVLTDIDLH